MRRAICFALYLAAAAPAIANDVPSAAGDADVIYIHGNVLTGVGLLSASPERVSALAVRNGLVEVAGSDAGVLKRKGQRTKVIDLGGAFVMPGFDDAHTHMAQAGLVKMSVDLKGVGSLTAMLARIGEAARSAPPGHWIQGGGWDQTTWKDQRLPSAADLDRVTGSHPAILERTDYHIAVVNTAALHAAGITRATPNPQGGEIDRDAQGRATGIVRDTAVALVEKVIPPPTPQERQRALELALADAAQHGVTSVQDYSPPFANFETLEAMERAGHLPVRVSEWLTFNHPVSELNRERASHPASDRLLHTGILKGFMDGSLGSHTAALQAPYSDDPKTAGLPRYQQGPLNAMTVERAEAHFQMGFHAIGDRAVKMALDAFATAPERNCPPAPPKGPAATPCLPRPRIEHSQIVDPGDFDRYRKLGVIASMQPAQLLSDMAWTETRLGPVRARYAYAWKTFLDHGVPVAFGTDFPVERITPFRGLYSAVTRQNEAGTQTFFPEQRLSIEQALYAYTQESAYAEFAESYKGRLAPGYVADFVVLDRDLTRIPPRAILETKVLRTVMNGHPVYVSGVQAR
jgi:predicted amidohydrolase YtcJ